jgi:hypothetical protein
MSQDNTARADEGEQQNASFSKKPPAPLYDNGHGLKLVRWEDGISNLQIERSYMPKGETDPSKRVTQKLLVTPEEALGIIFGLQEVLSSPCSRKQRTGTERGNHEREPTQEGACRETGGPFLHAVGVTLTFSSCALRAGRR